MNEGSNSILQEWVTKIGLRHQGVLLTVVRGYDLWGKYATEKHLIREMRGLILVPFDPRELHYPGGFMTRFGLELSAGRVAADVGMAHLLDHIDGLNVHYIMHIVHGCEVIGYCHYDKIVQETYRRRYLHFCHKFHLAPETREEMNKRLTDDRVAAGTVERDGRV